MGICPAVSIDKSVSRVGAKSLDGITRSVAFRIYLLINEYKQEASAAVKSSLFKLRKHRWDRLMELFTQRSPSYEYYSLLFLLAVCMGTSMPFRSSS
jgi:F0F1-type ATP synthase alpha subunit